MSLTTTKSTIIHRNNKTSKKRENQGAINYKISSNQASKVHFYV